MASPFKDKFNFITKRFIFKEPCHFLPSNNHKSTRKTRVTCTRESIRSWRGQNNLKVINLFLEPSQKTQTNFQRMFKYYIFLGSDRNLGWFGEFPHVENSILALAVSCCIHKHYANYVAEFCSFAVIYLLTFKNVPFLNC